MFAHSYSKNSHERAKEESYAVVKSSVLSILRNAAADHHGVMLAANSTKLVLQLRSYEGRSRLFLWLERRGHRVQLIIGIVSAAWVDRDRLTHAGRKIAGGYIVQAVVHENTRLELDPLTDL